jgi:hypothetical protein
MSKQSRYQVAKALRARLSDKGEWLASVSKSSGEFFLSADLLVLLEGLQKPEFSKNSAANALKKRLQSLADASPSQEELDDILEALTGAGLLVDRKNPNASARLEDGFGDPWIQWAMIADTQRCLAYQMALQKAVTPQTSAVDVGAGTGLLSALCLSLGAESVFAIEETATAKHVVPLLKKLGLPDRSPAFKLHMGNSFEAKLPANANLVVSELFGNDPFCEGVIPTLRDVASHLIGQRRQKEVQFVPKHVECFIEIVNLMGSLVLERVSHLWKARHEKSSAQTFLEKFSAHTARQLSLDSLSFPVALQKEDFSRISTTASLGKVRLDPPDAPMVKFMGKTVLKRKNPLPQKGEVLPVALCWFRATLAEGVTLSNHPLEKDHCNHWSPLLLPLAPFAIQKETQWQVSFALANTEDHLHLDVFESKGNRLGGR